MRRTSNFIAILAVVFCVSNVSATSIKWTGNSDKSEAATAPRSQRYWDEHNIERPDYAKTDAEVRSEQIQKEINDQKGGRWGKIWRKFVVTVIALNIFVRLFGDKFKGQGYQAGETGGLWNGIQMKFLQFGNRNVSEEMEVKARQARLARFDADTEAKDD